MLHPYRWQTVLSHSLACPYTGILSAGGSIFVQKLDSELNIFKTEMEEEK
jgi:hypothetical protein